MTDFQDKMACLEAMCREKYLNFDPCSVTAEDVKRGPGWMQPDKAYAKCLKDGFNTADGAGTSLNIGLDKIAAERECHLFLLAPPSWRITSLLRSRPFILGA